MFDVDISKGYVDMPVPEGIDLVSEIERIKREKNAVVLAHYYQSGDLQDIADYVGNSLASAQWAAKTDASMLVLCGVHFMGETAKIICPDKKVLIPDMNAGCSLADSSPVDAFAEFVKAHILCKYICGSKGLYRCGSHFVECPSNRREFPCRREDHIRTR